MSGIDTHLHFWRYDAAAYGWIAPDGALARDHLPAGVAASMAGAGIGAGLAVQARCHADDTAWLLELAAGAPEIVGVVGWLDLTAADIAARIADHAGNPLLVGLRHLVQDEPDDAFLLRPDFIRGVRACVAAGLAYDILVLPRQAVHVPAFLDRVGDGRFVLDHGAKPPIAAAEWQPWADTVARIAAHPGVVCKLSGLVTEADHDAWHAGDIARYMDHLFACFGPDRLMFGSDWPVCTLAASYAQVHALVDDFVTRVCPDARAAIFGDTARAIYRLGDRGQ